MGARFSRRSLAICAVVLGLAALRVAGARPDRAGEGQGRRRQEQADRGGDHHDRARPTGMTGSSRSKTNKNGEFVQIGLQPGKYKITADEGRAEPDVHDQRVRLDMTEVNFTLKPGMARATVRRRTAKKAEAKVAAIKAAFDEGVTLSNDGKIRRGDREVQRGPRRRCRSASSATTTSARSTRGRRTTTRPKRPSRRRSRSSRTPPRRTTGWPPSTTRRRSSIRRPRPARRRRSSAARARRSRRWRRQRGSGVQPGRHPLERRQDSRGQEAVRAGGEARSEARRRALLARHGHGQRRQAAGGGEATSRNT